MNTDSIFQIGKDHKICEDYVLNGIKKDREGNELAYVILADGCSSSTQVDIGARLLCLTAKQTLFMTKLSESDSPNISPRLFGAMVITQLSSLITQLGLHPTSLDTTLLIAWIKNKKVTAIIFGDGVFIHKSKTEVKTVHVQLSSGAPDYLSYHLDKSRREQYDILPDNKKEVSVNFDVKYDYQPFEPFVYESPVEEGDTISISSDGINSFRTVDNTPIDWQQMVDEFTGFKNFEGEFVTRRISAFKRKCLKDNVSHYDDISLGTIVV